MYGKGVLVSLPSEIEIVRTEMSAALKGVREELDEHLDTINQGTEELQASFEHMYRLEEKIERLGERFEQVVLILKSAGLKVEEPELEKIELSEKEKSVFMVLYTADKKMLTFSEIAKGVRESEFLVRSYVASLHQKGIPLKKKYVNNTAFVELDSRFKEMQAKKNIVDINQKSVKEFC